MGAVGRPSVAVGAMLAFLWLLCAIRPHQLPHGMAPIRWAVGGFVGLQLLGYVVGVDRGPTPDELSNANMWLIFIIAVAGVHQATGSLPTASSGKSLVEETIDAQKAAEAAEAQENAE